MTSRWLASFSSRCLAGCLVCCVLFGAVALAQSQVPAKPAAAVGSGTAAASTVPMDAPDATAKPAAASTTAASTAASSATSPATPTTTILSDTGSGTPGSKSAGSDPFLDVPPQPKGDISLVGGVVRSLDRIRNRMTVAVFGGKRMGVRWDERTHIFRDGVETTQLGIRKGDRVYVDTMLDRTYIFARSIRVVTESEPADARGQLLGTRNGAIVVQDELTTQPVAFRLDNATVIKRSGGAAGNTADLQPGALIAVRFRPDTANRGLAREITVIALPGAVFTFAGEITYLNLARGIMAVRNLSDGKSYDIMFNPAQTNVRDQLAQGAQATVKATFTGKGYQAQEITLQQASVAR